MPAPWPVPGHTLPTRLRWLPGLRDLLQSRGENVAGLVLRAMVPVSLHDPSLGPAQGNQYGVMVVPLPVGEPGTAQRLWSIAAQTAWRKEQPRRA